METVGNVLSGVSTFIVFLGVFLPEIAILAGFVSDLVNLQVRHIPTSAFGILAAMLNWLIAWIFSFLGGPAPAVSSFGSAWNWASAAISGTGSGSGGLGAQAAAISGILNGTRLGVGSPVPLPAASRPGARNVVQQVAAAAAPVMAAAAPGSVPQPLAAAGSEPDSAGITSSADGTTPGSPGAPIFNFNITSPTQPAPAPAPAPAPRPPLSQAATTTFNSGFLTEEAKQRRRTEKAGRNQLRNVGRVRGSASTIGGGGGSGQTGGAKLAEFVDDAFNPCAVRGLGFFNVSTRPMGIAVLTTIFFVYLLDMSVNKKRTPSEQTAYWLVAMGILGLNTYSYYRLGCIDSFFSVFTPLCVGLFVGGIAFWIYQSTGKDYLPMDPESGPATGEYSKCSATDGGGDFVCDAYLNGRKIGTVAKS